MVDKVLEILNIRPDKNQRWILGSLFLSSLLISFVSPTMNKVLFEVLPTRWFAFSSLIGCLSGILCGVVWRGRFRSLFLKHFIYFAIIECTVACLIAFYMAFYDQNMWIYAICTLIYTNLVSRIVGKCIMSFKSKMWSDIEREVYDNNCSSVAYIAMLNGALLAFIYVPSLKLSLFLFGICCIVDDIGWIVVTMKNKELLKQE